jgi:hypothetical protein
MEWTPKWTTGHTAVSAVVVVNTPTGPAVSWRGVDAQGVRHFARAFLSFRAQTLPLSETEAAVGFLYLVFSRLPTAADCPNIIDRKSPIAEFGYGSPPACPEDFPLTDLPTFLSGCLALI